jgi:RNA polymerase sigma-70 factor (ECF subfamily)
MTVSDVPESLDLLYQRHHGMVLRAAYRICGNIADAEDVLQTVFLRLARNDGASPMNSAERYLYRAAVNAALDVVRAKRDSQHVNLDDVAEARRELSVAPVVNEDDLRRRLRQALAGLNPRAAEMFALRYIEGRTNAEVARIMATSAPVVAVTLFRARKQLQKSFQDRRGK